MQGVISTADPEIWHAATAQLDLEDHVQLLLNVSFQKSSRQCFMSARQLAAFERRLQLVIPADPGT